MPYKEYFDTASEGLVVVDRAGRIMEVNPRAGQLLGYKQEELVGQPVELIVPGQLRERHQSHLKGYVADPHSRPMGTGLHISARRKDGSEFPVEISLTYARNTPRGDLIVAAITDISERLALEREARRAETLLSLGTLAAGIAHDLNNPLQVIRSTAELLLELPDTPADVRLDQETILRQAQRASAIVEEFLGLSRRRVKIHDTLNLNELIYRALLLVGEPLRKTGIHIETDLDVSLPGMIGDRTALERVLINLVTNARDAMPQGGELMISTGRTGDQPGWLCLTVMDTGYGIPADALSKIFDLKYTTKAEGSGLGLWLSRRIVQEHNGRLEVQSELGRGTTFRVNLPQGQVIGK